MITEKCSEAEWIKNKSTELKVDPILAEKAIYAFELVGSLVTKGGNFIFKGGTALLLVLPELRRLSIDVDILTEESVKTTLYDGIIKDGIFKRWTEDVRTSNYSIPKKHYKFHYYSQIERREDYVLLDEVEQHTPFPRITPRQIIHTLFEVDNEIKVSIPSVDGFVGDKLSTIAPTSIGIPYESGKSMELIKQFHDFGFLFHFITNLEEVKEVYEAIAKMESSYRGLHFSLENFLNDAIKVSFLISQLGLRHSIENDHTKELRDGINRIRSYVVGGRYNISYAKEDASKVALIASLIKNGSLHVDLEKLRIELGAEDLITDVSIPREYGILNGLKKTSPKSFHSWALATKAIRV